MYLGRLKTETRANQDAFRFFVNLRGGVKGCMEASVPKGFPGDEVYKRKKIYILSTNATSKYLPRYVDLSGLLSEALKGGCAGPVPRPISCKIC